MIEDIDLKNEIRVNSDIDEGKNSVNELSAIVFEETFVEERPYWKIWEVLLCFAAVYVISNCCNILCYASGLTETISGIIASLVQEAFSIALPFVLVYNIYGYDKSALGFCLVDSKLKLVKAFLLGIVYYFLATAILVLITFIYPYEIEAQATILPIINAENLPVLIILLLIAGIIAPIAEEIFFRGFLYSAVRHRFSVLPAAIISGILFGMVHLDLLRFIPISILGVLLCLCYEKYKNIYINMAVHIGFNCTSLFLLLLI